MAGIRFGFGRRLLETRRRTGDLTALPGRLGLSLIDERVDACVDFYGSESWEKCQQHPCACRQGVALVCLAEKTESLSPRLVEVGAASTSRRLLRLMTMRGCGCPCSSRILALFPVLTRYAKLDGCRGCALSLFQSREESSLTRGGRESSQPGRLD